MPSLEITKELTVLYEILADHWKTSLLAALVGYLTVTTLWTTFQPGLRTIPGPIAARFTRLFLLFQASKGNGHTIYQELHHKYGRIVRVGPGKVSISDPDMIPVIYNVGSKYGKVRQSLDDTRHYMLNDIQSSFYSAFTSTQDGSIHENLFATRDLEWHRRMKSTVAQAYSLSSLRQLESLVDECSRMFTDAMKDLAGQPIDLGRWVQWYAFDVIGNITFSRTFGFLKARKDSFGVVDGLEAGTRYNSIIGQTPEFHPWLLGNETLLNLLMVIPAVAKANPVTKLDEVCLERKVG